MLQLKRLKIEKQMKPQRKFRLGAPVIITGGGGGLMLSLFVILMVVFWWFNRQERNDIHIGY